MKKNIIVAYETWHYDKYFQLLFLLSLVHVIVSQACAIGWADLELFSKMDLLLMPKVEYPIG